jgi:hypothetical protein
MKENFCGFSSFCTLGLRRTSKYAASILLLLLFIFPNNSGATINTGVGVLRKSPTAPVYSFVTKTCEYMSVSKEEQRIYDVIRANYKGFIRQSYRPNFLKNSATGQNLELDIFLEIPRIGFEYQGAVHFEEVAGFNNDPDKSRLHDVKKATITDNKYSHLSIIEIFEQDLVGDIKANITQRCRNSQEYYFKIGAYLKCLRIERFIQQFEDKGDNPRKTWFKLLGNCQGRKSHKQAYLDLHGFYKTQKDRLPDTDTYKIENTPFLERMQPLLEKMKLNKEKRESEQGQNTSI